jgi:hypothetical protein
MKFNFIGYGMLMNTPDFVPARRVFFGFFLLLFMMLPSLSQATILKTKNLPELTQEADFIAVVSVESQLSLRDGPRNFIYTDYRLKVEELVYARPGLKLPQKDQHTVLRQIGGQIGDVEQSVIGTEDIKDLDRWVIFARLHKGRVYLLGMHQGGWFINEKEEVGPARRFSSPNTPGSKWVPKATFLQKVRSLLKESGR